MSNMWLCLLLRQLRSARGCLLLDLLNCETGRVWIPGSSSMAVTYDAILVRQLCRSALQHNGDLFNSYVQVNMSGIRHHSFNQDSSAPVLCLETL